jgi:hypothetical protein
MSSSRFGLLRFIEGRIRPTDAAANFLALRVNASIAANIVWTLPATLPASKQMMTIDQTGAVAFEGIPGGGGGGTVTSFSATPSIFTVTNPTTAPALSLTSQSQNLILASPSGAAGVPAFRALAIADLSGLIGAGAGTIAAGNDSRFHVQNTDAGTTAGSFQIDSGNNGARLKNASGAIQIRNAADNANADLTAANLTLSGTLTVQGGVTEIISNQLNIGDNIITLNNDVTTGTPTENAGLEVRRGAQPTIAIVQWQEAVQDTFVTVGSTLRRVGINIEQTFTNAELVSSVYTWNHGLGRQFFPIAIVDNTNETVGARIVYTSPTQCQIDLTGWGAIAGTWRVVGG